MIDARTIAGTQLVRLPAVVRGSVVMPPWPRVGDVRRVVAEREARRAHGPTDDGCYLIGRPVVDRDTLELTGETQVLVLPAPEASSLLEPDPAGALLELARTPVPDVLAFVDAVGRALVSRSAEIAEAGALLAATSLVTDRAHHAFLAQLPALFDGAAVGRMIERDLGTAALDAWSEIGEGTVSGMTARFVDHACRTPAALRAVPTRQLHLTAGNAPVVPVVSLLWAWATKGAAVIKPAAEAAALIVALGAALRAADPSHPLARHTTLAYWRGGDRRVETALLADGAFDRRVVWGTAETVGSVTARGGTTDTLIMGPRFSLSLIGAELVRSDPEAAARRAAVDSLIANQAACTSSLLHVVECDAATADDYARTLAGVLAGWDRALPHHPSRRAQERLTRLRRGLLGTARWYVNGDWPEVSSAVVRTDGAFDLAHHPGSRLVLVRAVDDLRHALPWLGPGVSTVGVAPEEVRLSLRDAVAARGVDNVVPLGAAEHGYAGRPHDGMRVLSRLVRWVNG
ncbi:acyl-CoA reductase [Streptosporangium sp. CA-135522]|uniref:acyl-CoA reductase n=1 Tax=Streptosporangium sp. CA-135522 TaxID=3240072 RepID=UPI003D922808